MYTAYFGFREEPFSLTPTSRLFYTNPVYEKTYTKLLEGIYKHEGFLVLTGEVGTGKTTLLRRLMHTLGTDPTVSVLFSSYSILTFTELFSFICTELGLETNAAEHLSDTQNLSEFLRARSQTGGTTVLLIDEAQDLEEDVLENLSRLSYRQSGDENLLQVILVGQQPELEEKLSQPRLHRVKQNIAVRCQLERLTATEVHDFIHHRLRLVGCERQDLFCPEAIQLVARYSTGIPRLVNLLCDNALQATCEAGQKTVSAEIIQRVAAHLRLKQESSLVVQSGTLSGESLIAGDGDTRDAPENTEKMSLSVRRNRRGIAPRLLVWSIGAGVALALLGFLALHLRVIGLGKERPSLGTTKTEAGVASLGESPSAYALRGQSILQQLMDNDPEVRPIIWGLATASPALALILPQTTWSALSKEDQVSLTWRLESMIPSVRAHPDLYIKEFSGASGYETFLAKVAGLCADCWVIGLGHSTEDEKNLLFDKIAVQGDSLWERAPSQFRGVKVSAFRAELTTSQNKSLEKTVGQR